MMAPAQRAVTSTMRQAVVTFTRLVKHTAGGRGGALSKVGRKSDNSHNFGDGVWATVWWCCGVNRTCAIPWES